jgi:hypothetical protein
MKPATRSMDSSVPMAQVRLHVEGVLGNPPGDAQNFYQTPRKYVLVASNEVDELAFLFRV